MLPNNCYNCKKCCKEVYDNDVNDKKNLLINCLNILNEDVVVNICNFLFHERHKVIFRRKSGNYVNSGFYWTEVMVLCSRCFHKGIMISLIRNNNLPRLRGDVQNFLNEPNDKEKQIIESSYGKNFYPEEFLISCNRSFEVLKNGIFYINSK